MYLSQARSLQLADACWLLSTMVVYRYLRTNHKSDLSFSLYIANFIIYTWKKSIATLLLKTMLNGIIVECV